MMNGKFSVVQTLKLRPFLKRIVWSLDETEHDDLWQIDKKVAQQMTRNHDIMIEEVHLLKKIQT